MKVSARRFCCRPPAKVLLLVFLSLLVPSLLLLVRTRVAYVNQTESLPSLDIAFVDGRIHGSISSSDANSSAEHSMSATVSTTEKTNPVSNRRENSSKTTDMPKTKRQASGLELPLHTPAERRHSVKTSKYMSEVSGRACQLEFGSYCLWSLENKIYMNDSMVRKLKDQLFVARAIYPSILKIKSKSKLASTMRLNILDHERMLSDAITDADLPKIAITTMEKMEHTLAKAKAVRFGCNNVHNKLRQIVDLTEQESHFHKKQGSFLYHLGAYTVPKSLHCLSLRLTVGYFSNLSLDAKRLQWTEFDNPYFQNYVIFSRNVLASSVAINSTVMNSKESGKLVFHIITDRQNYFAMKYWFSGNSFKDSIIHIVNLEELDIGDSFKVTLDHHPSFSEEFLISVERPDLPLTHFTEYISVFGHSQFILPDIFRNLKKVVLLDEDIVVQQDLSPLWSLDLNGKVNGAIHFCKVRFAHFKHHLGGNKYNRESCLWMSGFNVIDLEKWREQNITQMYEMLLQTLRNGSNASWRSAVLPAGFLAFEELTYPLDDSWVLSGLGSEYNHSPGTIRRAAVLHYNGDRKPWLDLGIQRYKKYWKKFLARGNALMDECNIL